MVADDSDNQPDAHVPSWRLRQEAEAKRQALARAEAAENRVRELEAELDRLRYVTQLAPTIEDESEPAKSAVRCPSVAQR